MLVILLGWSRIDRVDKHAYAPYGYTSSCDCVRPKVPKNVTENKPLDLET